VYRLIKRFIDICVSSVFIIILMPFFLIIMIILKFTGEGKIFYLQSRIGKNNKPFNIYKFITMRKGSESAGSITYKDDPRILPFGKFLRNTKINEIPQLFNIFKGDISIVGPRPLVEEGFLDYPEKVREQIYKDNKPGLTGMGSLFFCSEEEILTRLNKDIKTAYKEDIMPIKGQLELWYREHKNIWVDFKIIILTPLAVISSKNQLHTKAFNNIDSGIMERYKEILTKRASE